MRLGYAIALGRDDPQDAAVQHGQHQRAREVGRRGGAQGHGARRPKSRSKTHRRSARRRRASCTRTATRAFRPRPTSSWSRSAARSSRSSTSSARKQGLRRPSVPADDHAHARLDRHRRGDGPLHDRVQGDLPRRRRGTTAALACRNSESGIRNSNCEGDDRKVVALSLAAGWLRHAILSDSRRCAAVALPSLTVASLGGAPSSGPVEFARA